MIEQNWSGSEQQDWSVQTKKPELARIEPGQYGGVVSRLEKIGTSYGEAAKWYFVPDDMDVEVTAITSIAAGNLAKPAEWARRILGLSDATDQTYGKDIKHRNPAQVNWGPKELKGKPCRFVVADRTFAGDDGEELTVSGVVNVLPPTGLRQAQKQAQTATEAQTEEDLDTIPF